MKEIRQFTFVYKPWDREYPIKECRLVIVADTRKDAELIALESHKFFDEDCLVQVIEGLVGYRQE